MHIDTKRVVYLGSGAVLIAIALSAFIVIGIAVYQQSRICITGSILVPQKHGIFMNMGEVEVCGSNLSTSGVYKPSLEGHIFILRKENEKLQEDLLQCKASLKI